MGDYGDPYVYQTSRSRVRDPSELREFPPYEDIVGKHPMVRDHLELFAQAPWFDPVGIRNRDLMNQYLVAGEYPGVFRHSRWAPSIGPIAAQYACKQFLDAVPRRDMSL